MIEIKNACKYYENGNIGIEEVNLRFPSRGIIGIIGKSGSGKSSLLNRLVSVGIGMGLSCLIFPFRKIIRNKQIEILNAFEFFYDFFYIRNFIF